MNLEEFDQIIWLIVEEAINKNCKNDSRQLTFEKLKARFHSFIRSLSRSEESNDVNKILKKVLEKINTYQPQEGQISDNIMKEEI